MTFTEQLELTEKRREDEITRTHMEAELKSLHKLESLRQRFDIKRERWRKEKEKDSDRLTEWKTLIQGERDKLLKRMHEFDGGSEPSGAAGSHGGPTNTLVRMV